MGTTKVDGGNYYGVDRGGRMFRVGDINRKPDARICRRVADYPPDKIPAVGVEGVCVDCGAAIIFNPNGPHQDIPTVCMQCRGVEPLPIV